MGECQSPICTNYSVTLVLACSAAPVGRIADAKYWHSDRTPVEWVAKFWERGGDEWQPEGQRCSLKEVQLVVNDCPDYRFIVGKTGS